MSEDNFSSAIQYWKGIQLSNLQKELDQQGLAIVEKQKDGLVSRKKLAEQTRGNIYIYISLHCKHELYWKVKKKKKKEFKKIPDEEKVQKFKPLLKGLRLYDWWLKWKT